MNHAKATAITIESGTASSRQVSTIRVSLSLNIRFLPHTIARDGMLNSLGEASNNNLEPTSLLPDQMRDRGRINRQG